MLMELFARDQDLVRQATEGAKQRAAQAAQGQGGQMINNNGNNGQQQMTTSMGVQVPQIGSQHPMNKIVGGSSTLNKLGSVPSLNSWPHFSSVSSLNNLGTMTGVKSINNMSGADLVNQGSLNKQGNLAQVKSLESMGRTDSFAFLEVFFDNPLTGAAQRGIKREREEDDNVGLSLDPDDSSSPTTNPSSGGGPSAVNTTVPAPVPIKPEAKDKDGLKRAYDDALAARGLISVSRSSEKLTDLALPAKMQRTISQDYLKSMNGGAPTTFTSFSFPSNAAAAAVTGQPVPAPLPPPPPVPTASAFKTAGQQYTGQTTQQQFKNSVGALTAPLSDPSQSGASVEVPSSAKCAICHCINVDTQLRPCGHMFHGRCLKPSLQNAVGPPKCPIDHINMQSAVLAVPTDESEMTTNRPTTFQTSTSSPVLKAAEPSA